MSKPRLILWTLNIDNYQPVIRDLSFPMMQTWAHKIGAEFRQITERKFPGFPVPYEKLQLHELGKQSEWTIFLDADALVHPDMYDPTCHIPKDTVAHNGRDMANFRWRYDQYFMRDGRHIGSCNWCAIASEWCLDLWKPLDIPLEEALRQVHPIQAERAKGCVDPPHLLDDFTLSRNIARYGLKFTTLTDICAVMGMRNQHGGGVNANMFHLYNMPEREKVDMLLNVMFNAPDKGGWGLMSAAEVTEFRKKWSLQ